MQAARERDNQRLMIVTDGQGVGSRYDLTDVDELIRQALATLKIQVDAGDPVVRGELEKAASTLGMQIADRF